MSGKTVFLSYRRDAAGKAFARLIEQALPHRGRAILQGDPSEEVA